MSNQSVSRLLKVGVVFVLMLGVAAVGLFGGQRRALAHEVVNQTYMVHAGAHAPGGMEVLAFAPAVIQVHQGDTIMWHIASFHNVHFEDQPIEFLIAPMVGDQPVPQLNPEVGFPTIANGASYTGGNANSALPGEGGIEGPTFSLVIDAPVGRYAYFCDIHLGMAGVIEVVADDVEIPSPAEVEQQAQGELSAQIGAASAVVPELQANAALVSADGVLEVTIGGGSGRTTVNQFNSPVGVINVGETVTWVNPVDSIEPHFVNSTPYDPVAVPEIVPQMQENAPPVLLAGPGFLGTTPDGAEIKVGDTFNSAFILPGQTFSLTFTEAGVYLYNCHIHPGMNGVVIVK